MKLECPNGHLAVVRNDPRSTGFLAMCDQCGWSAAKVVAREDARFNHAEPPELELERVQLEEEERRERQLAPPPATPGPTRRRAD